MKLKLFATALALISSAAFADIHPLDATTCPVARQANAIIMVFRNFYVQNNGVWTLKNEPIGSSKTTVPVVDATNNKVNCKFNGFQLDNVMVNGQPETVNVSSWIELYSNNGKVFKRFSESYWSSINNGRGGWTGSEVNDPTFQWMKILLNLDQAAGAPTAHAEYLTATTEFTDDAQ